MSGVSPPTLPEMIPKPSWGHDNSKYVLHVGVTLLILESISSIKKNKQTDIFLCVCFMQDLAYFIWGGCGSGGSRSGGMEYLFEA